MKTAVTSRNKLKLVEIALLVGLAAFLASGGLALRAQTQLAERVVRLHVLANSDGEEDQELKLLVRDRVLARATELLTQAGNRAEAESLLRRELPELEDSPVLRAVQALPEKYRQAVYLRYYEEYEVEEIAALMGCGAPQVSTYLYRGRQKLKTMLGGIYGQQCLSE